MFLRGVSCGQDPKVSLKDHWFFHIPDVALRINKVLLSRTRDCSAEGNHFHCRRLSCADRKFEGHDYASEGIIVASVEEVLHDLAYLVGYHSNRHDRAAADDGPAPQGQSSESSQGWKAEWNKVRSNS